MEAEQYAGGKQAGEEAPKAEKDKRTRKAKGGNRDLGGDQPAPPKERAGRKPRSKNVNTQEKLEA